MKDLRITEFFTTDELTGIYNAALAEFTACYEDKNDEGNENYLLLLFVDYAFAAYKLRQCEEYMEMYNNFKEICEARGNTSFLRVWEGVFISTALRHPELEVTDILRKCAANLCDIMEKHFGDLLKD